MATEKDYLSEFEQEWNSGFENTEIDNENDAYEFEDNDQEFETDTDSELETDDEFEVTADDNEFESGDDQEFENDEEAGYKYENKLYSVLTGNHETELEFEQQLNEVLHEIEKDYFWSGLKKRFNKFKKSGLFSTLKKLANKTPLGDVIKQYTALARGDIKGMLKGLAGQALTSIVPGGGVAKQLLNLEAAVSNPDARTNAQVINKVAKNSYANLINQLGNINSASQLNRIKSLGKLSFSQALQQVGTTGKRRRKHITLNRGDVLVIRVR
jgi:hypothetical protein